MREQQLNGHEVNLGEWEANLKFREKRLENAKLSMESVEDRRYEVSYSIGVFWVIWVIRKFVIYWGVLGFWVI